MQSLYDNGRVATLTATIIVIMNAERNNNVSLEYMMCKIAMKIGTNISISIHLISPDSQGIENDNSGVALMDIDYINKCTTCQKVKGLKLHQYTTSSTSGNAPFTRIALDDFGPLPRSTQGNTQILVVMDTFTKYVEIHPMHSTSLS